MEVAGTADDGPQALELMFALNPDVSIVDISMPGLDGIAVVRRVSEERPSMRCIMLTMHGGPGHVFQALAAGVRGYVLKESAGREIVAAIRAVSAGRRYLSPRVAEVVAENLHSRAGAHPIELLSKRESEILRLVADGYSSAEIGTELHLSPKTVDSYRSRMMQKLGLPDLAAVIKFAIQHGLTTL